MTPPTLSEPAGTPEPMAATKALILDIDGVVSPVHGHTVMGRRSRGRQRVRTRLRLADPVRPARHHRRGPNLECAWLTDWSQQMRHHGSLPRQGMGRRGRPCRRLRRGLSTGVQDRLERPGRPNLPRRAMPVLGFRPVQRLPPHALGPVWFRHPD
jgi:hypothetical protein